MSRKRKTRTGNVRLNLTKELEQKGWARAGYTSVRGAYFNDELGEFQGKVELFKYEPKLRFYIKDPPYALILTGSKFNFKERRRGWYRICFQNPVTSVAEGVKLIEEILEEAAQMSWKINAEVREDLC